MDVLVAGAAGAVGRRLTPALRDARHDVRALVRDPGRYDAPAGVTAVRGDPLAGRVTDALAGADAAYYLLHSLAAGRAHAERDRRAAHNFAAAATEAGVDRVVYLGALGDDADAASPLLRARREVEHALATGDYDLTTLRAGAVIGSGSVPVELVRQLATRLPLVAAPRWARRPVQPVAVDDAASALAGVLDAPSTRGESYELAGPETVTTAGMLRTAARLVYGRAPEVVGLPAEAPTLSARWIALLTDLPVATARRFVLALRSPLVAGDDDLADAVGAARTHAETALERALSRE